jgi:DNA repair exonuclease SbcCD nuclease subunit
MKALVYGDLQATEGSERCFHNRSISLQQWRVRKFYADLHRIFVEHRCDCLWDLGDTTDDRCSIPIPTIDVVLEGLARFPTHPWNLKLIGNHEQFLRSTSVHVGKLFQGRFQVVEEPKVIRAAEGTVYVLCPFPYEDDQLAAWIEAVLEDYPDDEKVLLGHFQVIGCKLNSGESKEGVPKALLKDFKLGLLGHVHKPQSLFKNVHYVGSPFQQDKGESGEAKRVGVVDMNTLEVTWVEMTGFPRYQTYTLVQFNELADAQSEDRVQVVLRSQAEAEQFYAHPLSSRADPVYQYNVQAEAVEHRSAVESWTRTRKGVILKYFELCPPNERGISLPTDELASLAEHLADAED